ncbi:hypothetical protein BDB00DRAFT_810596 [Zychaea mexicana]|uniref:uncharacterized protein n=1 Tax=Zychaea mexicana TaxID=64656 RepID=UPI0022FE21C2|nr:uncharacterized protein BDB00DRAFT_810596 [Zychaea mexicana]KAI9496124.1 hypothetical protein BDB00DRAFT_810596 [Zychaea mexicana]
MSSGRLCFSQSVINDVLRAIVSRPITVSPSTTARCPSTKSYRHAHHQALCSPLSPWQLETPWTRVPYRWMPSLERRMYTSRALSVVDAEDDHRWHDLESLVDEQQQQQQQQMQLGKQANAWNHRPSNKKCVVRRELAGGRVVNILGTRWKKPKRKPRTVEDYNRAIMFAVMDNRLNKAVTYVREMERRLISLDTYTYTIIINGYSKLSDMERAQKWFRRMKRNGIEPDVYTYTSLIDGYMRVADVASSEAMFRGMMLKGIRPTLVTYNVLMHHSVRQLDVSTAVRFWSRLVDAGLQPDAYTFAIMMHGLGDEGRVDQAWRLYEEMKKENVDVNEVVATTLMGIHVKHHDNSYAIELFRKFFESGRGDIAPTPYTRNVMLNAVVANANLSTIHKYYDQFLQELADSDKQQATAASDHSLLFNGASVYTYTTFMRAFLRRDALPMVSQVYQDMRARHVKPTMVTYAILMLAHSYIPDPDSCVRILTELRHAGFRPNVVLYTIVMRAWAKAGRWDEMKKTYADMKADNIEPNKSTMSVLQWGSEHSRPMDDRPLDDRPLDDRPMDDPPIDD